MQSLFTCGVARVYLGQWTLDSAYSIVWENFQKFNFTVNGLTSLLFWSYCCLFNSCTLPLPFLPLWFNVVNNVMCWQNEDWIRQGGHIFSTTATELLSGRTRDKKCNKLIWILLWFFVFHLLVIFNCFPVCVTLFMLCWYTIAAPNLEYVQKNMFSNHFWSLYIYSYNQFHPY